LSFKEPAVNIWDIILLVLIAAAFIAALRKTIKKRKNGCCGSCSTCGKSCKR